MRIKEERIGNFTVQLNEIDIAGQRQYVIVTYDHTIWQTHLKLCYDWSLETYQNVIDRIKETGKYPE